MAVRNDPLKVAVVALSRIAEVLQGPFYDLALRMLLTRERRHSGMFVAFQNPAVVNPRSVPLFRLRVVRRGALNSGLRRRHKITNPRV